jgi:hypothetical protein
VQRLAKVAMFFATQRDVPPARLTADSAVFLDLMGRVVIAWIWVWQANIAAQKRVPGSADADFYAGKLQAARYFIRRELPRTVQQAGLLMALDDTCIAMQDDWF